MKPDWKDAPKWASYLAKDGNGHWYWHEREPDQDYENGVWRPYGGRAACAHGDFIDWTNTLEQRPE